MNRLANGLKVYPFPKNVAVVDDVDPSIKGILEEQGLNYVKIGNSKVPSELAGVLNEVKADVLVLRTSSDAKGPVITETPLSLIHAACKGPHADLALAQDEGVEVIKVDTNREQVWAWVRASLCSAAAGMAFSDHVAHRNTWAKNESGKVIFPLERATLGVLGFGDVGQRVAMGAKTQLGMKVLVHNHSHPVNRPYDDEIRGIARGAGVSFVESRDELIRGSDILTVHIDGTDALGNSNKGVITPEYLAQMREHRKLGIFINGARGDVAPDMETLDRMLREGKLLGAFVDAHPTAMEKEGAFRMPEDAHPNLVATHHIAGSGKHITRQTAVDVGSSLERWLSRGEIWGTSRVYPHTKLHSTSISTPGAMLIRVHRSTMKGAGAEVLQAVENAGLEQIGERAMGDRVPGAKDVSWRVVPHLIAINGITDLAEDAQRLAYELDKVNKRSARTVVSVQFFPTTPEQRKIYEGMRS